MLGGAAIAAGWALAVVTVVVGLAFGATWVASLLSGLGISLPFGG